MIDRAFFTFLWLRAHVARVVRDERGEGVISTAIAVLIMAFLGALMWFGFQALWNDASSQTSTQIADIGSNP
ncbi:MAG: DUF6133 family protein [Acidimicrobiales bacterium]